jgi:hypothetical protein
MNEFFTDRIKFGIRTCQFHIQGVIPYFLLENISTDLFQLQHKGVWVEFIILMDDTLKSIRATNTLLRIAAGGGQIYTLEKKEDIPDYFLILDKNIVIRSDELREKADTDLQAMITGRIAVYQQLTSAATPVIHVSGCPEISFSASSEWVKSGETIKVEWDVNQAQSVCLLPQNITLPMNGSLDVPIDHDCLLVLLAKNEYISAEKRIFIKALTASGLTFSVRIFNEQLNTYLPLEAHPEIPLHYAIPPDSDLRLFWESEKMGLLEEENWGALPSSGHRDIRFKEDSTLNFTWKTLFQLKTITLHFFILSDNPPREIPEKKKFILPLFKILKKRP